MKIRCDEIEVNHSLNKSRVSVTPESCVSLADSISKHGQDTLVKVTANPGGDRPYLLRVGFRRYTAINDILAREFIEAEVVEYASEDEAILANVRENIERKDMTYFEECCALRELFPKDTQIKVIAEVMSRSTTWVRCRWSVWELESEIILGIETGDFTPGDISLMIGRSPEEQIATAAAVRLGKAQGETRDEIAAKVRNHKLKPNKEQVGRMLTLLELNGKGDAKYALLWAMGDIDNEEFINYTGCKAT